MIKTVLEEFVPDTKDAIMMVKGRVCLVDGTITPCWVLRRSTPDLWSRKKSFTGFNTQLISPVDGTPAYLSDPIPARRTMPSPSETRDDEIVPESGGARFYLHLNNLGLIRRISNVDYFAMPSCKTPSRKDTEQRAHGLTVNKRHLEYSLIGRGGRAATPGQYWRREPGTGYVSVVVGQAGGLLIGG